MLDYGAGIWGFKTFPAIDIVQHRAIRYFLGVHKYTPNLAITGDMGWESGESRRNICMMRLWNRLLEMDDNRLTKKIFYWDLNNEGVWTRELNELCNRLGWEDVTSHLLSFDLSTVREALSLNNKRAGGVEYKVSQNYAHIVN